MLPRWVAWQAERRGPPDAPPPKVPYSPATGRLASATDPASWGTRAEAEVRAALLPRPCGLGGVGIVLGDFGDGWTLAGVDLDTCTGADGALEPWADAVVTRLATYAETSPSGTGVKLFGLISAADLPVIRAALGNQGGKAWKRSNGAAGHPPAIEFYTAGRYFTLTGLHLPDTPGEPQPVPVATILWLTLTAGPALAAAGTPPPSEGADQTGPERPADRSRSGAVLKLAGAMLRAGATFEAFAAAAHADPATAAWAREKGELHDGRELRRAWAKADADAAAKAKADRVILEHFGGDSPPTSDAPDHRPDAPENGEDGAQTSGDAVDFRVDAEADESAPSRSEEALALAFAVQHAARLRHVAAWGRWLRYDGRCWRRDDVLGTFSAARRLCRQAARTCNKAGAARALASAKTVAAVERLARADRRLAATVAQWDGEPWALNTPAGMLNMRNGGMHPHRPEDYATQMTAVAPDGDCPLWRGFLHRITDGDAELTAYLQRVAGYLLTGSIREHALFFCWGGGANGKSTFMGALAGILGDYARAGPLELLTVAQGERHPTELAMLRGARLVTMQETDAGARWAEAKLRALTGGDRISARFMRQDFFDFDPTFKLVIASNHKPGLRSVDEAIRRRLHLIPFGVVIPPAERDRDLPDKLKVEWPAILAWAVDGCQAWQRFGLMPPARVLDATAEYLTAEDAIGLWLAECCTIGPQHAATTAGLFASWRAWAEAAGEYVGSQRRLTGELAGRGFRYVENMGQGHMTGFTGLMVGAPTIV